ncbi:MAG: Uma2 family endonuclease [Ginsengibacter sp.]
MATFKILPNYTYADYCNWEGRWEVIDGIPFAMSPTPSIRHQWIKTNLLSEFVVSIKKSGDKNLKVYPSIDFIIEDHTIVQPGCSIVYGPTKEKFLDFAPSLVAEVLSENTLLKDRHTKFSLYENFAIQYYMIVDADNESVEIYSLQNSKYVLQQHSPDIPFNFSFEDNCEIELLIKNIWE